MCSLTAWVRLKTVLDRGRGVDMVDGYRQVSEAVVAERLRLASSVASILNEAGLPVMIDHGRACSGGAVVEVDRGDDAAGGVYVSWQPDVSLTERNNSHLLTGDLDHVDIAFSGRVCESMMEAMLAILRYRGVDAAAASDDLRPHTLRVSAHGAALSRLWSTVHGPCQWFHAGLRW